MTTPLEEYWLLGVPSGYVLGVRAVERQPTGPGIMARPPFERVITEGSIRLHDPVVLHFPAAFTTTQMGSLAVMSQATATLMPVEKIDVTTKLVWCRELLSPDSPSAVVRDLLKSYEALREQRRQQDSVLVRPR